MKWIWGAAVCLCVGSVCGAENSVPAGTLLPVRLETGLNAGKVHVGQLIRAQVMQDVPGTPIRRRARILGHIVNVHHTLQGGETLALRFDSVASGHGVLPLAADLRALASFTEVEAAQVPEEGAERGITPEVATTRQIGGEQVYRGGGPVAEGQTAVGTPTAYGVLAVPRSRRGQPCRGVVADTSRPQALWLFSSTACGVYGYDSLQIQHAGRTAPRGQIVLYVPKGKLALQSGSGLLLRVE